ncbi:MAG: hypothetical protein ACXVCP_20155 [Bdellovibrio sp.]
MNVIRALWAGITAAFSLIIVFQGSNKTGTGILFLCGFFASWIFIVKFKIKKNYLYWPVTVFTSLLMFGAIAPFFGFPFNQTPENIWDCLALFRLILMGTIIMLPNSLLSVVTFIVGDIFILKKKFLLKG